MLLPDVGKKRECVRKEERESREPEQDTHTRREREKAKKEEKNLFSIEFSAIT